MRRTIPKSIRAVVALACVFGCGRAMATDEKSATAPAAGPLRLLPSFAPADAAATAQSLAAAPWVNVGLKNILGAGIDETLTFRKEADGKLTVARTVRRYQSVNARPARRDGPEFEEIQSPPEACTIDGPVLRYGNQQQTFVVVPGKALVLNAVVRVGGGKWYYTSRQTWREGESRDEEMLLDFADDPLTHDEGKGTLRLRAGPRGELFEKAVRFTVSGGRKLPRTVQVVLDDEHHAKWVEMMLDEGGAYGLMIHHISGDARVYTAGAAK